jgi:hypothetical protein
VSTTTAVGRGRRGGSDPGGGVHASGLIGGGGHLTGHRAERAPRAWPMGWPRRATARLSVRQPCRPATAASTGAARALALGPCHLGVAARYSGPASCVERMARLRGATTVVTDATAATALGSCSGALGAPMVPWPFPWDPSPHIDLTEDDDDE